MSDLSEKFWIGFARNHWERKALHLKNLKSAITDISEKDVFAMLVDYANQCRKMKDPNGFKFFIHGYRASDADVLQVLPTKKDKNFFGYHERMKHLFQDYCLVCDELLNVSAEHQKALLSFTQDLYKHVGFPNRFTEIGLYLGNYKKTPFGVHVDSCGVFSFPVTGVKKFRLWKPNYVEKHPDLNRAHTYSKHKANSELMVAKPGDMTYWPSSAWHIAESNGEFSATWSLGVWVDKPHNEVLANVLKEFIQHKTLADLDSVTTEFDSLHNEGGEIKNLPKSYKESLQALSRLSSSEIELALKLHWLRHVSTYGFKTNPQSQMNLSKTSDFRLVDLNKPILWVTDIKGKNRYYAFGGKVIKMKNSKTVHKMILDLNFGKSASMAKYLNSNEILESTQLFNVFAKQGAFSRAPIDPAILKK